MVGRILNVIGVPGFVVPVAFHDDVTGEDVSVKITRLFTIFSVGNRDYYFYRLTGKIDGTGWQNKCNV